MLFYKFNIKDTKTFDELLSYSRKFALVSVTRLKTPFFEKILLRLFPGKLQRD